MHERVKVLFTTNPGIEDIASAEIAAKLQAHVVEEKTGRGRVLAEVSASKLHKIEFLRSIHRARIVLARARICPEESCLKELHDLVRSLGVEHYIPVYGTFAVRSERVGVHEFTSLDVARVVGDAIVSSVKERLGFKPEVDLEYPSVIVTADVIEDEVFISIELGGDLSWHRRGYRVYDHPAALKPTLAYAMIMLSGAVDGMSVLDPMCGGGTIPVEAAYTFEDSPIVCMDKSPRHIRGAVVNAKAALVDKRIKFLVGDARRLSSYVRSVDVIVSNPPYGIRIGSPRRVRELYRKFVAEAANVVEKSITLITTEHEFVKEVSEEVGLKVSHERTVAHGGLYPHIIVLSL
jgi:tRNA (guanine6-N2)-methyltransferase